MSLTQSEPEKKLGVCKQQDRTWVFLPFVRSVFITCYWCTACYWCWGQIQEISTSLELNGYIFNTNNGMNGVPDEKGLKC